MAQEEAAAPPFVGTIITAVEEEDEDQPEDIIPGPPPSAKTNASPAKQKHLSKSSGSHQSYGSSNMTNSSSRLSFFLRGNKGRSEHSQNSAAGTTINQNNIHRNGSHDTPPQTIARDPLQISTTDHQWAGQGILASRADLELPPEVFAAGCNLLQAAAMGDGKRVQEMLEADPRQVDFRDYDRRTRECRIRLHCMYQRSFAQLLFSLSLHIVYIYSPAHCRVGRTFTHL